MSAAPAEPPAPALRRALGRWDLTAIGINQVIGGAIFLLPSQLAAYIGNWSPIGFAAAGFATLCVALCFAEVGSRFDRTGGVYLAARAAFGPFAAFEVAWMQWFTRASSQAAVANGIALALGFWWPAMKSGAARAGFLVALTAILAFINARGIRQSAWTVNALTVGKLAPLAVFVAAGLWYVRWDRLLPLPAIGPREAGAAGLLLYFAYGGFDVVSVPAAEANHPRRHIPFALVATIVSVTLVMTLTLAVAMTAAEGAAASDTPLASAALAFLGPAGAAMIGIGSVLAMLGNSTGQVLAGSRMLFAMAENGALPRFFAYVHPVRRTPSHAIWFTSAVALALGLTGSFAALAAVATVARLVTYTGACVSTLVLRRRPDAAPPALFTIPFGPAVPVFAVLISLAILYGATGAQLLGGAAALAAGAALYALARRGPASC
jgi:amino acid transporter